MRIIDVLIETIDAHKHTIETHKPAWDIHDPAVKRWLEIAGLADRVAANIGVDHTKADELMQELERKMASAGYII